MERLQKAVIDSSVLLKWFQPDEADVAQALALRDAYLDERLELIFPDLAAYEVGNVLRHRVSEPVALQSMEILFDLRIPIHRLNQAMLQQAVKAAFHHKISVYDAVFLATAESLHWQLVTADVKFHRAIHRLPRVSLLSDLKV